MVALALVVIVQQQKLSAYKSTAEWQARVILHQRARGDFWREQMKMAADVAGRPQLFTDADEDSNGTPAPKPPADVIAVAPY